MREEKDSDDFFHDPGCVPRVVEEVITVLLFFSFLFSVHMGELHSPLSHHAIAGLDAAISSSLWYKSVSSHFNYLARYLNIKGI